MSYPKISIVTPSFNQDEFLEQTIQSVVSQNYPNLEYIVIDGGSSDNSPAIIKNYSDNLSYWISEPDGGHGNGLNKGFSRSTGEIMGWINSDDMLTAWSLRTVAEIFTKFPHVNWIHGTNSFWNRQGQMIDASETRKNVYDYLTGNYAWIQQESVFWRRSLWDKAGGKITEELKFMVDSELWSRFFLIDKLYTVNCVLSGYRTYGDNSAHKNYSTCISEMQSIVMALESKCDARVLRNAKSLRQIMKATYFPLVRKTIGVSYAQKIIGITAGRTIWKKLFNETGYNIISWDIAKNDWVETRRPFRSFR